MKKVEAASKRLNAAAHCPSHPIPSHPVHPVHPVHQLQIIGVSDNVHDRITSVSGPDGDLSHKR